MIIDLSTCAMKFKNGCSRGEVAGGGASLEELISLGNEVRLIDAFVNSLPLEQLGFRTDFAENGRPAYHSAILLKLLVLRLPHPLLSLPGGRVRPYPGSDVVLERTGPKT
ncbi:hypothetical protein [Pontibacter sp. HSC-36F09]|uniref:hypothetical protein n=1 Tax=Pontibacter sp. HSC-36F09 TaxID=2910966 RepID=UPI0020A1AC35|nr:hypothetical protein [Pontibacter sp. HSC-36F09]MCP2045917.1 transposase [Pontibacter sp. HSC-36F09]